VDLESRLRLDRDVPAVQAELESCGGELVRRNEDPAGLFWAVLQPVNRDRAPFIARIQWTVYPDREPSVLFALSIGGPTTDLAGWPAAQGYRPPNDICKPFTAEGQALHAEWRTGVHAWRADGNPFLFVVQTLWGDIDRVDGARAA